MIRMLFVNLVVTIVFIIGVTIAYFTSNLQPSLYTYSYDNPVWGVNRTSINIALSGAPRTLDPQKAVTYRDKAIVYDLFEGLMKKNMAGASEPGLIDQYTVSQDGKTYTFNLKSDLKWSDGTPLKASDFVFAFSRLLDPKNKSPYAYLLYPVLGAQYYNKVPGGSFRNVSIVDIDSTTLKIVLAKPTYNFLNSLSHFALSPLPQHVIEKYGDSWFLPSHIVSNAAYFLSSFKNGASLILQKNKNYYDANSVFFNQITYYVSDKSDLLIQAFRSKYVDIVRGFDTKFISSLTSAFGEKQVFVTPLYGLVYLEPNLKGNSPLRNVVLRRALSLSIDRETMLRLDYPTPQKPAYTLVNADLISSYKSSVPVWKEYDNKKRTALALGYFGDAGYSGSNILKLSLVCQYNTPESINVLSKAVNSWSNFGVDSKIVDSCSDKFDINSKFDFMLKETLADDLEPIHMLKLVMSETASDYLLFNNKKYDDLVKQGYFSESSNRYNKYSDAENLLNDQVPIIPLYYPVSKNLVSDKIFGWENNYIDVHLSKYLYMK